MSNNSEPVCTLKEIFFVFLKIGAFTFGGGYAMLPLIREDIISKGWIKEEEFLDILATGQSVPGALAVNTSLLVGYKLKSYKGAGAALLGSVLPSFFIMLTLAIFFLQVREIEIVERIFSGIRPAVAALIAAAALKLGKPLFKKKDALILIGIFSIFTIFLDIHPILIIVGASSLGLILYGRQSLTKNEKEKGENK